MCCDFWLQAGHWGSQFQWANGSAWGKGSPKMRKLWAVSPSPVEATGSDSGEAQWVEDGLQTWGPWLKSLDTAKSGVAGHVCHPSACTVKEKSPQRCCLRQGGTWGPTQISLWPQHPHKYTPHRHTLKKTMQTWGVHGVTQGPYWKIPLENENLLG